MWVGELVCDIILGYDIYRKQILKNPSNMKKALIVIDNLYTGGIASSFLNFLNNLVEYVNCDILIFNGAIPDRTQIPKKATILSTNNRLLMLGCSQKELQGKSFLLAIIRAILVFLARITSGLFARRVVFAGYKLKENYDIAISFTHDDKWNTFSRGCNQFILSCVNSKEKATFVHCDFSKFEGFDLRYNKLYKKFNHIICVSESCRKSFVKCFSDLDSRSLTIENFTNVERVIKLSNPPIVYNQNVVNVVSICRISKEKGLFRAAKAFKRIVDNGITNFHWTIVGGGELLDDFKRTTNDYKLSDYVTLVGEQKNPYQYLVNADIFLLPSYHEAAPMVFGECNVLGVPIISTETVSARELVEARSVGVVCDNTDEGIYRSLKATIENNGKIDTYVKPDNINKYPIAHLESYLSML